MDGVKNGDGENLGFIEEDLYVLFLNDVNFVIGEKGGLRGLELIRYGDWERKG